MIRLFLLVLALASSALPLSAGDPAPLPPASVVVLYNSAQEESKALADYYAQARSIPAANLIGLPLPETDLISRDEFNTTLRDPLRSIFEEWQSGGTGTEPEPIRVLLTVRGVPFGIKRRAVEDGDRAPAPMQQDEASIDSELALLLLEAPPTAGHVPNPRFRSETPAVDTAPGGPLLTCRIDGPSLATCRRLIDDALATEEAGLWGRCYLDLARKPGAYEVGDTWLHAIARQNLGAGIPTVVDTSPDTFVTNYPMREASLYYGWYAPQVNGPFLDDGFRFQRGAVAVHLHSFSAARLRNPDRHWCGPLLEAGAAATVGNVFEPYLQFSHHFDVLHDRLLRGFTLVEAAAMATPVLSWQTVVLGDPLYRPFARFSEPRSELEADRDYRTLRDVWMTWPDDPDTRTTKVRSAASKTNSGTLYEALGLFRLQEGDPQVASAFFGSAHRHFAHPADRLRVQLHANQLLREADRRGEAIAQLRALQPDHEGSPGARALEALLLILDPPAPPPARPAAEPAPTQP